MAEPDTLTETRVASCARVAARQVWLTLGPTPLAASHTIPGQYALLSLDEGAGKPIALASAPGCDTFEMLLKPSHDVVEALAALVPGDVVRCSGALGRGYPLERARGKSLWLVGVGSGVAPLRSVIEAVLLSRRDFQDVHLAYGVRHEEELVFTDSFARWEAHDVDVLPIVSQPRGWAGATGYVQQHIPASFERPGDVVAFVCGTPAMDRDVGYTLAARGVSPEQTFRNW